MKAPCFSCLLGLLLATLLPVAEGSASSGLPGVSAEPSRMLQLDPGFGREVSRRSAYRLHVAALNDRADDLAALVDRGMPADAPDPQGKTALMLASAFGNLDAAKALLKRGADPNARGGATGASPLHFAAMAGDIAVATLLLERGAQVDARDSRGETPLHYAAFYNRDRMIEHLASAGAELDATNHAGVTPFNLASRHGRMAAVAALSDFGARQGGLTEAVNAGDLIRVRRLLAEGAAVNAPGLWGTALHAAAGKGFVAIAAALLDAHADIEAAGDPAGAHPLHIAALVNDSAMAAFLVESGADIEARDALGRTSLEIATRFKNHAVAAVLMRAEARRSARLMLP